MEHNKKEGGYMERNRARWSTARRRGVIGRERERDGAQQGGGLYGEKESEMEHSKTEGRYRERKRAREREKDSEIEHNLYICLDVCNA